MNTTSSYRTRTITNTWLGARATASTYQISSRSNAPRVTAHFWTDDCPGNGVKAGDLLLKFISGDIRKDTFVELAVLVIPGGTQADVDAFLAQHLPVNA